MADPEKSAQNGLKSPDKAHIPTSKYNTRDRDLESQGAQPLQSPSVLASGYGINPSDQPSHPPRRVTSSRSLRHGRSQTSLRSPSFARSTSGFNIDHPDVPPLPTSSHHHQPVESTYNADEEEEEQGDDASLGEELAWGPSHPCFPHRNSHVPLNSHEYATTRIIRIRRDWMIAGDLAPSFSNIYPEILDPLMPEPEFRFVIEHINRTLLAAYDPFSAWNWVNGFLGLVTGWFWEDFHRSFWTTSSSSKLDSVKPTDVQDGVGIKSKLKNLEKWIEVWNYQVGSRDGVKIIPLRRTGYMNVDIQIPDPQVRVVNEGEESDGNGTPREEAEEDPDGRPGTAIVSEVQRPPRIESSIGRPGTALEIDLPSTSEAGAGAGERNSAIGVAKAS